MKKILFTLIACYFFVSPVFAMGEQMDYDKIYNNLPEIQNIFYNGEDPDEIGDYKNFYRSPYPLIRTWSDMYCKKLNVSPGYYLLTPRFINGQEVVLFKQRGVVKYVIPAYEVQTINPDLVYPKIPETKYRWYQKFFIWTAKRMGEYQKPLKEPQSAMGTSYIGRTYFLVDFYYQDKLYKMIFKLTK